MDTRTKVTLAIDSALDYTLPICCIAFFFFCAWIGATS